MERSFGVVHHVVFSCTANSARSHGLDLAPAVARGDDDLDAVPDPVDGDDNEYSRTFDLLSEPIDRLARAVPAT